MENIEIWKDVIGYEGLYQVSSLGNVRSEKFKNRSNLSPSYRGAYLKVNLYKVGQKRTTINIHRLVCIAFHDNNLNKPDVNHIDGCKINNRVENLEWCTKSENMQHCDLNNLREFVRGENRKDSKLKNIDVIEIRKKKMSVKDYCIKYKVSRGLIELVQKNKIWTHI